MRKVIYLVVAVGVALAILWLRHPAPEHNDKLAGLAGDFVSKLESDLTDDQRQEIEGLLSQFQIRARQGEIRPEDQAEVAADLSRYNAQGGLAGDALYKFMAKVSFYTFRLDPGHNPEDGSGVHPLLKEDPADSTIP